MQTQPVGTKLLAEPLPKQEVKLKSGLVMPETAMAELMEAVVVAVPESLKEFKVGDVILYPSKKGVGHIEDNKFYLWLDAAPHKEEIWGFTQK